MFRGKETEVKQSLLERRRFDCSEDHAEKSVVWRSQRWGTPRYRVRLWREATCGQSKRVVRKVFGGNMLHSALLVFLALVGSISASGRYGDITRIPKTGASCATARQDRLNYCGVKASERMAQTDLQRVNNLRTKIKSVANKKGMDAAVIAGIISRESRGGSVLKNGWGDGGNAWGVMQVDKRFHKPRGAWNSEEHISQGTDILIGMFNSIKKKFPKWTIHEQLKGAIAAYNTGAGRVNSFSGVDSSTTGKDYSNDVTARAVFFKKNGY